MTVTLRITKVDKHEPGGVLPTAVQMVIETEGRDHDAGKAVAYVTIKVPPQRSSDAEIEAARVRLVAVLTKALDICRRPLT